MQMKEIAIASLMVLIIGTSAWALTPTGNYTITFERTGWSQSKVISVQPFPTPEPFYQVGGQAVNVYLNDEPPDGVADGWTWYVNALAVLGDPTLSLLGGSGDLTITITGLKFLESSQADFIPAITHLYYADSNQQAMWIPGWTPVGGMQQRSPIRPLDASEPDYAGYAPGYGMPYQDVGSDNLTFVLPDLYVPDGAIYELSFGAGFVPVPEPMVLTFLGFGLIVLRFKNRSH